MTAETFDFVVRKDDLKSFSFLPAPAAEGIDLADGEVVLKIDRFAFTANNVTYGVVGDRFSYWDFFPAAEEGWGRIPVWGFADVVRSNCDDVAVGQRFYGYLPMSSFLVVRPDKVTAAGFLDNADHRQKLHPVYNTYILSANDPVHVEGQDDYEMLMRPLYMTSWVIDDYLDDNDFFGAGTVILSSASSKTSFGLAFQLHQNRRGKCRVIGLTSPGNVAFVEAMGTYDQVVTYDAVATLASDEAVIFVDMAGNKAVRRAVHEHFGDNLKLSSMVGVSHWTSQGMEKDLPGPAPTMFFAPDQIRKRSKDWGPEGVSSRFATAWRDLLQPLPNWLTVEAGSGPADVERVYLETLEGRARPDLGYVLSI
jgi:hypothetical protein